MTKKERETIKKWEFALYTQLEEAEEEFDLTCDYTNLIRAKWTEVYKLMKLLGLEVER